MSFFHFLINSKRNKKNNSNHLYNELCDAITAGKRIIGRHPMHIQVQTISSCNAKCRFCPYRGSWHHHNPGEMSWETYKEIIRSLKGFKIKKFCPYFENEPLLDKELFSKIEYAAERLDIQHIELSTNLSVLNSKMLKEIENTFSQIPHEIRISFHGISKETYENIMGLSFENSINNVLSMLELSQKTPLNIMIRGTGEPLYKKDNLITWFGKEQYIEFWDRLCLEYTNKPQISFFKYHDRAGSKPLTNKKMTFNEIFHKNLDGFYCVRFDQWMHFLYTGEPIFCCMDYTRETAFGKNIMEFSIDELYRSDLYIELLKKGLGLIESEDNFICKRCISPGG